MANPLQSGKHTVKLGQPVRASRIRRDPPPIAKKLAEQAPEDRDARVVFIGVVTFALAFFAIIIGFSNYDGWSLSNYTVEM